MFAELRLREYVSLEITDKNSAKECVSTLWVLVLQCVIHVYRI